MRINISSIARSTGKAIVDTDLRDVGKGINVAASVVADSTVKASKVVVGTTTSSTKSVVGTVGNTRRSVSRKIAQVRVEHATTVIDRNVEKAFSHVVGESGIEVASS